MMTAKENVIRTLRHDNPEWIPVNLWQLPAAKLKYGQALDDIINRCEIDILSAPFDDPTEDARHYQIGSYTDCWGSTWDTAHRLCSNRQPSLTTYFLKPSV